MSLHTEFDKGSLIWVKSEIEETFSRTQEALQLYAAGSDDAALRHAQTYLHQACGALTLVDLPGVARFCEEIEQAIAALSKGAADRECIPTLVRGIEMARAFLQRLMTGMPNQPLLLLPVYREIAKLSGNAVSGADLFFPQLQLDLPAGLPQKTLSPGEFDAFMRQQRSRFEGGLLRWLQSQPNSAQAMAASLSEVATHQNIAMARVFWWTAAALVLGLSSSHAPVEEDARQLLMRINLQMRRLAGGSGKVAERLFRDMLYVLAQLDCESVLVKRLQQSFELSSLIPSPEIIAAGIEQDEQQLAHSLRDELQSLKEIWSRIAAGQTERFDQLREQLATLAGKSAPLASPALQKLLDGLGQMLTRQGKTAPNEAVALEFATGLLLAANALAAYPEHPEDYATQVDILLQRLENPGAELELPQLDSISREAQERLLNAQLAQEIRANLRVVEDLLDGFFRDRSAQDALNGIAAPLRQVQGALLMMDRPLAGQLLQECQKRTDAYLNGTPLVQDELEVLAEALSTLGFYIDDLEQGREKDEMLSPVLAKLCGTMAESEISITAAEILEAEPELAEPGKEIEPAAPPTEMAAESRPLPTSEAAIDAELLDVYLEEAIEVLATIEAQREACHADAFDREALTVIRRSFHTLKGSGRMVGLFELGEVAWAVEQTMNKLLQLEKPVSEALLKLIADTHSAFSGWVEELKLRGQVDITGCNIPLRAQALREEMDSEAVISAAAIAPPAQPELQIEPAAEEIVIGPVTVSSTLFAIFQEESEHHLGALRHGIALLAEQGIVEPGFVLAAHTLGGIVSTTGFRAQGELAYALEHALQQLGADSVSELPLLNQAVVMLDKMLTSIVACEPPITAPELVCQLESLKAEGSVLDLIEDAPQEQKQPTVVESSQQGSITPQAEEKAAGKSSDTALAPEEEDAILSIFFGEEDESERATEAAPDEADDVLAQLLQGIYAQEDEALEHHQEENASEPFAPETCHTALEAFADLLAPQQTELCISEELAPAQQLSADEATPELQPEAFMVEPVRSAAPEIEIVSLKTLRAEIDASYSDDIDEQLLPIFIEEADELMPAISTQLHALSHGGSDDLGPLRRTLHTMKGSARMSGAMRMGEAAHRMETLLDGVSQVNDIQLTQLDNGYELLSHLLDEISGRGTLLPTSTDAPQALATEAAPTQRGMLLGEQENRTTIRVKAELVDQLVNQAGEVAIARSRIEAEMLSLKGSLTDLTENVTRLRSQLREIEIQAESQMQARTRELQAQEGAFDPLEFDRFTRLQELTRFIAESVNDVSNVQQSLLKNFDESNAALTAQARMTRDLQQSLMRVRLVPFNSLSERLYRLARTTGKEVGKKINLEIRGGSVEIDRGVLEQMISPFEHMLRNAIDHGIENPADRQAAGKPEFGEIQIEARQEGNELVLLLKDDGHGLDLDAIHAKGIEKGLVSSEQALSAHDIAMLIFEPGFSTAGTVTQLSGRGIGMDVVRNEISNLGGRIDLSCKQGEGTTFIVRLPLTLAVTQVLLVRAGERTIAIPSVLVEQVQELKHEALTALYAQQAQEWQGKLYPFAYLPRILGDLDRQPEQKRFSTVLLLRSGTEYVALHVDDLIKNLEVVVKPIGPQLARVPGVVGGTVLGSGEIVLIMNPLLLLPLAEQIAAAAPTARTRETATSQQDETLQTAPVIMVVDDSLTVRKITSRLLTREGFHVVTAKDGVDALQQLQEIKPAVMLVDIEMPRMDGFEFTRTIRATPETRNIPIVMITSRTAEKHRKAAFDLGVNVFLGKPFQEDELLEHVRRLSAS